MEVLIFGSVMQINEGKDLYLSRRWGRMQSLVRGRIKLFTLGSVRGLNAKCTVERVNFKKALTFGSMTGVHAKRSKRKD